jgi:predicted metalloprotease with PDZ domain
MGDDKMSAMATMDRSWRNSAALLVVGALAALILFLVLRPLRVETPASGSAQALLRLDSTLGATVEPVDRATAGMLGLRSGGRELVVTSVANGGPAAAAGLRVGDVIERIGGRPAGEQLRQSGSFAAAESLDIRRGGKPAIVNLQLGNRSSG